MRAGTPRPLVLAKYHLYSLWNWRSVYVGRVIEPAAYFVLLGGGFTALAAGAFPGGRAEYLEYILSGLFCLLAFRGGTSALSDVANDRKWGVYALYRMQGRGRTSGYLLSIVLVGVGVFTAQAAVLLLLFVVVGAGASMTASRVVWTLACGAVIATGWICIGSAVAATVDSYSRRDLIVTLTSLPVVLAAPLFYPLDGAPAYLRVIAAVNPLTYQVGWLRDPEPTAMLLALAWALLAALAATALLRSTKLVTAER